MGYGRTRYSLSGLSWSYPPTRQSNRSQAPTSSYTARIGALLQPRTTCVTGNQGCSLTRCVIYTRKYKNHMRKTASSSYFRMNLASEDSMLIPPKSKLTYYLFSRALPIRLIFDLNFKLLMILLDCTILKPSPTIFAFSSWKITFLLWGNLDSFHG